MPLPGNCFISSKLYFTYCWHTCILLQVVRNWEGVSTGPSTYLINTDSCSLVPCSFQTSFTSPAPFSSTSFWNYCTLFAAHPIHNPAHLIFSSFPGTAASLPLLLLFHYLTQSFKWLIRFVKLLLSAGQEGGEKVQPHVPLHTYHYPYLLKSYVSLHSSSTPTYSRASMNLAANTWSHINHSLYFKKIVSNPCGFTD